MPHGHIAGSRRSYGHGGFAYGRRGLATHGPWSHYQGGLYGHYPVGQGVNYYVRPSTNVIWPQYDNFGGWGGVTPNQVYYQNWNDPYNWQLQRINYCLDCGANLNHNPICSNCV